MLTAILGALGDILRVAVVALERFALLLEGTPLGPLWPIGFLVLFQLLAFVLSVFVWVLRGRVWPVACGIVSFFDHARLAGEQGLCYVRLRRFDDAKAAFQTGLARLDDSSKIRARLLTGLATVHVRQGEIEQACRTAGEAWRIATRTRTALSLQQVYDVRRQLERWQDSRAVRELDEQLRLAG